MKKFVIAVFALSLLAASCNRPDEPSGTPVALTAQDLDSVSWAQSYKKDWAAWHLKGVDLANAGSYDKALYSFHQALNSWPEEVPDTDSTKDTHKKEPTDTLLQLGELYLKMNRPDLALYYFEKFDSYIPGNKYAEEGIRKSKEMLD